MENADVELLLSLGHASGGADRGAPLGPGDPSTAATAASAPSPPASADHGTTPSVSALSSSAPLSSSSHHLHHHDHHHPDGSDGDHVSDSAAGPAAGHVPQPPGEDVAMADNDDDDDHNSHAEEGGEEPGSTDGPGPTGDEGGREDEERPERGATSILDKVMEKIVKYSASERKSALARREGPPFLAGRCARLPSLLLQIISHFLFCYQALDFSYTDFSVSLLPGEGSHVVSSAGRPPRWGGM